MSNTREQIVDRIPETRKNGKAPQSTEDNAVVLEMEAKYPIMTTAFKEIQREQYVLFCKKQKSYGRGNIMLGGDIESTEDKQGAVRGIVIRMNDKMQRLLNLVIKGVVNPIDDESVDDTFLDLSVYGIIARIVKLGKWK